MKAVRYDLGARLAVGGMAEVFLASAVLPEGGTRSVVVKRILPQYSDDPKFMKMFIDEAVITGRVEHPNIVKLYEFGRLDEQFFLALEYVPGLDLEQLVLHMRERGTLVPMEIAAYVVGEILAGLHYAHTRTGRDGKPLGIVHRDVTPSNVMLGLDGVVKLGDFGIAKASVRRARTNAGTIKGNFQFMAPEQADGQPVDRRADIYAAGMVLRVLLTGQLPFDGDSIPGMIERVSRGDFPGVAELNPDAPAGMDAIVKQATALDPAQRFATAQAFRDCLLACARECGAWATAPDLQRLLAEVRRGKDDVRLLGGTSGSLLRTDGNHTLENEASAFRMSNTGNPIPVIEETGAIPGGVDEGTTSPSLPIGPAPVPRAKLPIVPLPAPLAHNERVRFAAHRQSVSAIAFTGATLVSAGNDHAARIWDLTRLVELACLRGHTGALTSIAAGTGGVIVSGSRDKTARVWRVGSEKCEHELKGHTGWVSAVAISADGLLAASGGIDKTVRLWDVGSGAQRRLLEGHTDAVSCVTFLSDGRLLSASYDQSLRLWRLDGTAERVLGGRVGPIRALAVSPDDVVAVSAGADGSLRVWDLASGAQAATLPGHDGPVVALAFVPGTALVASASYDGTTRLWNLATREEAGRLELEGAVTALASAPGGGFLAMGNGDGSIALWAPR